MGVTTARKAEAAAEILTGEIGQVRASSQAISAISANYTYN